MSAELFLDKEQRSAAEATERAIAVLAGPGSGKTRVLSYRTRYLLSRDTTSRALLLTFTNKAAAEMKARALGVTTVASERIRSDTYHSFCMRLLRSHGQLLGLDPNFDLMDEQERKEFARRAALSAGVHNHSWEWSTKRLRRTIPPRGVAEFGSVYQEEKRRAGVVDFDDLIVSAAQLLAQEPELAATYGEKYQHLLIDEFQDTNPAQFEVVRAIASHASTISVFADDDQAIFRFAGAEVENIRRFREEIAARIYPLTVNYRCRQKIVDHANLLIRADDQSSGRIMKADKKGGEVHVLSFETMEDEASALISEVQWAIKHSVPPEAIAILVRSGYRVQVFLKLAEEAGLPLTNWLTRTDDSASRQWMKVCLSVVRSTLTEGRVKDLCRLFQVADAGHRDTREFLEHYGRTHEWARQLLALHHLASEDANALAVVKVAQQALASVSSSHGRDVQALVDHTSALQASDPEFSLDHLLSELALFGSANSPTEEEGVKVASLHRTKGLQWPCVYLLGLENGHIPDHRVREEQEMREERRLCFVGVCRAEDRLTMTFVKRLGQWARYPSPFLKEMGLSLDRT